MAGLSTASPSALTPKSWAPVKRDYPVTPRENLMMALNHKKPLWMPNIGASSQLFGSKIAHDSPPAHERTMDTTDWFGVRYKYSPAYGSNTPQGNVLNCVTEWRERSYGRTSTALTGPPKPLNSWRGVTNRSPSA